MRIWKTCAVVIYAFALLAVLVNSAAAQSPQTPAYEIFVRTKNTGGSSYTFAAQTTDDPRWGPDFYLTTGYTSSSFSIVGDNATCNYGWDFNGSPSPTLGHNVYKITVSPGTAWFKADAYGSNFQGDLHVVYDAQSGKFLLSGASCGYPYLTWSASTSSVAKYNVYQSTSKFGTYYNLNGSPISPTNWTDDTNTLGEEVRVLADKEKLAGTYQVEWDGKDDGGRDVPSGMYFSRIVAGSFTETKKMLLVR